MHFQDIDVGKSCIIIFLKLMCKTLMTNMNRVKETGKLAGIHCESVMPCQSGTAGKKM